MAAITEYTGLDYATIASRLSTLLNIKVQPSKLEVFSSPTGSQEHHTDVLPEILSGCSEHHEPQGRALGLYFAEFTLRLNGESLRVQTSQFQNRRGLRETARDALSRILYLAENPGTGEQVQGGREIIPTD